MEESTDTETDQTVAIEHDINKISTSAAKVVLLVAFKVNCFDYLSVRGNLHPLAKHLKLKVRGLGKYDMAKSIPKELLKKGYVTPRDPAKQELNYNAIKRSDIECRKDVIFMLAKLSSRQGSSTSTGIIPSSQGHKSGSNNSSSSSENSSVNVADSASSGDDDDKMSDREEQFEMRA